MSTPHQPSQGSGHQEWGQPGADPAAQAQQYGSQGQQYGNPGQYGSQGQQFANPGQQYGSQGQPYGNPAQQYGDPHQQYGSQGQQFANPGQQYGSQGQQFANPGQQYGSQGQPYGNPAQQYGDPHQQYSSQGQQYGSQGQPQGAQSMYASQSRSAVKSPSRPGSLVGPLSMRDLALLFAALLAFIGLMTPFYRFVFITNYLDSIVFSWSFWGMGMVVLGFLPILVAALLTLLHKTVPGFPSRLGSFSIAQVTSVLASVAFTAHVINVFTSAPSLHVGAWLGFLAALIAFFFGVFTFLPFLAAEYTSLPEGQTHPKARSATAARGQNSAAQQVGHGAAGVGGAAAGAALHGTGLPPQQQYGSQGQAYGDPAQQYGSQGQAYGDPAQQYGSQGQAYGDPAQQYGSQGQPYGSEQTTAAEAPATEPQNSSFANTEQGAAQADALSGHSIGDDNETAAFSPVVDQSAEDEQSTAEGQAYLGRETASAPAFAQSEPTQAFAAGAFGSGAFDAPQPAPSSQETAADEVATVAQEQATGADSSGLFVAPQNSSADASDDLPEDVGAPAGGGDVSGGDVESTPADSDVTAATGPYVAEDTVGAEPAAAGNDGRDVRDASAPEPAASSSLFGAAGGAAAGGAGAMAAGTFAGTDAQSNEKSEGDSLFGGSSVDSALSTDSTQSEGSVSNSVPEPAAATALPDHEGASDEPGDAGTDAEVAGQPAAVTGSALESDASAGGHFRGEEQSAVENEPTQWFRMGEDGSEAPEEEEPAASYDATQGEPTQAFSPVVSQMFWFAVTEPRAAVDPVTGQEIFTVTPNEWFLALEDHGSFFKVRDAHGQEGYLNNVDGIIRG